MADELHEIRERKLESLKGRAAGSSNPGTGAGADTGAQEQVGTPGAPIHVEGPDHLHGLVAAHDVVLADFYADWCGPCQLLGPVGETIAAETGGAVAKIDVGAHQTLAGQFQVRGVPAVVLFADGEVVERFSGVRSEDELPLVEQNA